MTMLDPVTYTVSSDTLMPIIDGLGANIAVILPVAITVFAVLAGVSLVPKIIKHFKNR